MADTNILAIVAVFIAPAVLPVVAVRIAGRTGIRPVHKHL